MALLATWASRGAKWSAVLYRQADGYRLSERKHGQETGASYRPFTMLSDDTAAIEHYTRHVAMVFDTPMKRVD